MDIVPWFQWEEKVETQGSGRRIYVGNESCQLRLPRIDRALEVARQLHDADKELTFVTPFLTDEGLERAAALVEALAAMFDGFEVVCNDWGFFDVVSGMSGCVPIVGRLLVKQDTDPRIALMMDADYQSRLERPVTHADGTEVLLRYAPLPESARTHVQSLSLDSPEVLALLGRSGANRFEVSNVLQGLQIQTPIGWHATVHMPDVLIAVARYCNVPNDGRGTGLSCGTNGCKESATTWRHSSFAVPLYHVDNAAYCLNKERPRDCEAMGIDRIIVRQSAARWEAPAR